MNRPSLVRAYRLEVIDPLALDEAGQDLALLLESILRDDHRDVPAHGLRRRYNPKIRSAAPFQDVMTPSRVLLTMASSEESMIAARRARLGRRIEDRIDPGGRIDPCGLSLAPSLGHRTDPPGRGTSCPAFLPGPPVHSSAVATNFVAFARLRPGSAKTSRQFACQVSGDPLPGCPQRDHSTIGPCAGRSCLTALLLLGGLAPASAQTATPAETARAMLRQYQEDPARIDRARDLLEATWPGAAPPTCPRSWPWPAPGFSSARSARRPTTRR